MLLPGDVGRVLTHYNLGTLENVSKAFHGFVNETIFITTTTGRYVMRRNHRRFSEETHRYRHALIRWLGQKDFPTSQIIPTKEGDTLLVLDGRSYEIAPFIEAHDYDPNHPAQNVSVGKTLGQYHQAIKGFDPPLGESLPRYSAHDVMALSERLLERDIMGDLSDMLMWYDLRAAQIRRILPDERYAELPHVLIHGDVHRDNFLFQGDEVAALIDFDQATWDARISDLADLLVGFSTAQSPNSSVMAWGVYKGPIELDGATRMLAAYHSVNPLSETEIKTLPIIIELVWLQGELGRVFSTPEGAPEYHTNVLEQGKWLSEWMQKNYNDIVKQWLNLPPVETSTPLRILAPAA